MAAILPEISETISTDSLARTVPMVARRSESSTGATRWTLTRKVGSDFSSAVEASVVAELDEFGYGEDRDQRERDGEGEAPSWKSEHEVLRSVGRGRSDLSDRLMVIPRGRRRWASRG